MKLLDWMTKTFDDYGETSIRVVCVPLPPSPVRGLIYMPDCFTSKTFDNVFDRSHIFRAMAIEATHLGPAILAVVKLKDLISFGIGGLLEVSSATCCANISYRVLCEEDGLKYASEVELNGLTMRSRSCHPGSHYVVPEAPFLTALLQYAQSPTIQDDEPLRIDYMSPIDGKRLFSDHDFWSNSRVDEYISRCAVDLSVTMSNVSAGIGRWARPHLSILRRNRLDIKEANYVDWFVKEAEVPSNAG